MAGQLVAVTWENALTQGLPMLLILAGSLAVLDLLEESSESFRFRSLIDKRFLVKVCLKVYLASPAAGLSA